MSSNPSRNLLVVITGPTASGKTALSVELASRFDSEVISADSRQIFREMKVGTARPEEKELRDVPHHLLASHSIHDEMTAGIYAREALAILEEIFQRKPIAFLVGGTGLYIQAVTEGLDELPSDRELQKQLNREFEQQGLEHLSKRLERADPEIVNQIDMQNPVRVIRALEIIELAGKPLSQIRREQKPEPRPFRTLELALMPERKALYERIDRRVDEMMEHGLLEECRKLYPHRHLKSLRTVGYQEIFEFLEGKTTLEEAVDQVKQHSRNYAKRQMTWIRKSGATQVNPTDIESIEHLIREQMQGR